jgi:hypothetical protein
MNCHRSWQIKALDLNLLGGAEKKKHLSQGSCDAVEIRTRCLSNRILKLLPLGTPVRLKRQRKNEAKGRGIQVE